MKYRSPIAPTYSYASSVDRRTTSPTCGPRLPRPDGRLDRHRHQPAAGDGGAACRPFRQQHRHLPDRQAAPVSTSRCAAVDVRFPEPPRSSATPPWERSAPLEGQGFPSTGRGERVRARIAAGPEVAALAAYGAQSFTAGRADPRRGASSRRASRPISSITPAPPDISTPFLRRVLRQGRRVPGFCPRPDRPAAPTASRQATSRLSTIARRTTSALRGTVASHAWVALVRRAGRLGPSRPDQRRLLSEDHVAVAWDSFLGGSDGDIPTCRGDRFPSIDGSADNSIQDRAHVNGNRGREVKAIE